LSTKITKKHEKKNLKPTLVSIIGIDDDSIKNIIGRYFSKP